MTSPDLSDRDVLELLDRNHKPEEIVAVDGHEALRGRHVVTETKIRCKQCHQPYPCPTRQAIKEHEEAAFKARLKKIWAKSPMKPCGRKEPHDEHSYTGFAVTYYCPGTTPTLDCGREEPHEQHQWTSVLQNGERTCPGTSYELIDCDDAARGVSHGAHSWNYRGGRFWCHGG